MKKSIFDILISAGNKKLQNTGTLLSIAGTLFALACASQDGSRLEILLGISTGLIGQLISFCSLLISRITDERIRTDMERRYVELQKSLETAELRAERLNELLTPRSIIPEKKSGFIEDARKFLNGSIKINIVFDAGFDSAQLARDLAILFQFSGWRTDDGGALMSYGSFMHGISISYLPAHKEIAENIATVLRNADLEDVVTEMNKDEWPSTITVFVYRAKNKLGSPT